jgi:hypothetical protein
MIGSYLRDAGIVVSFVILVIGCTNSRTLSREEKDPLKFEYNSFQPVTGACLTQLKDTVAKRFGPDYAYSNTIPSREPGYREAIFSRIESKQTDSSIVIKFDSLCVIKRIFSSMMMIGAEEYH